jgi:glycosyltransferase involved in cell wall biosynthesis
MSISVVIPLYNKAPHIERALKSVLSQTVLPDEIIVVDDGSTDGGGEIVKSIDAPGLRLIRQENQGGSAARNQGIAEAEGDLIAFLDADDAWKPRFIEVITSLRAKYPNAGAYGTAYESINPDGVNQTPKFDVFPGDTRDGLIPNYLKASIASFFGMGLPVCSSASAIPKKVFEAVGGFPVGEYLGEDADTWLRVALVFPIAWSSEYLAIYYRNAVNRAWSVKRYSQEPVICRTIRRALQSDLVALEMKQDLKEFGARFQLFAARDCLVLGKRDTALQLLGQARGTRLFAREWWKLRFLAMLPGKSSHYLWKIRHLGHRHNL